MPENSQKAKETIESADIKTTTLHKGGLLTLFQDHIACNDDKNHVYDRIEHPGAVALLPITNDNKILFVKQYRHPINKILLELPAGVLEEGEQPETCAIRELREETGYSANSCIYLQSFYVAPGYSNEQIYFYLAKDLFPSPLHAEDTDGIDIISYSIDEAFERLLNGEIKDAKTLIGIFYYKALQHEICN